mmetsp:Transcript_47782/g.120307  ORF Transcript_47782/g.120307 Transcript_47782/m.120307 type:complete len:222 (+) Transcript_47782:1394-2059(+)
MHVRLRLGLVDKTDRDASIDERGIVSEGDQRTEFRSTTGEYTLLDHSLLEDARAEGIDRRLRELNFKVESEAVETSCEIAREPDPATHAVLGGRDAQRGVFTGTRSRGNRMTEIKHQLARILTLGELRRILKSISMIANMLCGCEVGSDHSPSGILQLNGIEARSGHLVGVTKALTVVAEAQVTAVRSGIEAAHTFVGGVQQRHHAQIAQVLNASSHQMQM